MTSPDVSKIPVNNAAQRLGTRNILEETINFEDWKITTMKSSILPSNCYCNILNGSNNKSIEMINKLSGIIGARECQVCRFSSEIKLKHFPDMVFPDNLLSLENSKADICIQFNCLDAMKTIPVESDDIHIAVSEAWKKSRTEMGLPTDVFHNFNWTFNSNYKGSIKLNEQIFVDKNAKESINFEKLKRKEPMLFFSVLKLFEDELHDNGVSDLTVKVRVMPSGFFVLQRYFLRVDNVFARTCDTRIYFESGNKYLLRQYQVREDTHHNFLHLEPSIVSNPDLLYLHLPVVEETTEKISFENI